MGSEFMSGLAKSNIALRAKRFSGEIDECISRSKRYTLTGLRQDLKLSACDPHVKATHIDVTDVGIRYYIMVMIKHFARRTGRTAILNPADYLTPGGGYLSGDVGYEETICANTVLYEVLSECRDYYVWNNDHMNNGLGTNVCLYTPDVIVCDNSNNGIGTVDVISCSPPNYGKVTTKRANKAVKERAELIFNTAVSNNINNLVLCDFGCSNPDSDINFIANMFRDMCTLYCSRFENITFVMDAGKAYNVFEDVFKQQGWVPSV